MKRYTLLIQLLLGIYTIQAQNAAIKYPSLKSSGKSLQEFIPAGWEMMDSVSSDFDKNGLKDYAIIIKSVKAIDLKDNTCFSSEEYFPKILYVVLQNPDHSYTLSVNTHKIFSPCNWGLQGTDAFAAIKQRRNTLALSFISGGTLRTYTTYYFRLQNNGWYLIGKTNSSYQIPSPDTYVTDRNYLAGVEETYEEVDGQIRNKKTSKIGKEPLRKLIDLDAYNDGE